MNTDTQTGYTAVEIANKWGVDKLSVYGMLKVLEHKGLVKVVGERRKEHTRGKPSALYVLADDIVKVFGAI